MRIALLSAVAKVLRVTIWVDGIRFGAREPAGLTD
jgi:hypothetical protein